MGCFTYITIKKGKKKISLGTERYYSGTYLAINTSDGGHTNQGSTPKNLQSYYKFHKHIRDKAAKLGDTVEKSSTHLEVCKRADKLFELRPDILRMDKNILSGGIQLERCKFCEYKRMLSNPDVQHCYMFQNIVMDCSKFQLSTNWEDVENEQKREKNRLRNSVKKSNKRAGRNVSEESGTGSST